MATAQIPPVMTRPTVLPADTAAPVLLVQLQDDLSRSHMREALWVSVVIHLLAVIFIVLTPKWLPVNRIYLPTNADLLRDKEVTFLEAPPDSQRVTKRPDTNIISDKDRIATTRKAPTIDRETLQRLLDARRPGPPGAPGLNTPPAPPPVFAQGPSQQPQARAGQPTGSPPEQVQTARLESPSLVRSMPGAFGGGLSPGSAIARAAQETAMSRGGGGGVGGEFGLGQGASQGKVRSDIDIVSDTMGVDFGPYLSRVLQNVRTNWYHLIPEVARAPLMKRGKVSIQFAIMKDGRVAGMQLLAPSGDVSLDRAAWGGITASDPFPPLPREFGGQYLALRFHFFYNPDSKDLQ
jgi:TonB family protein